MGKLDEAVKEQLKDSVSIQLIAEYSGVIEDLREHKGKIVGKCPYHESDGRTCCQLWEKENIFFCLQCYKPFDHFTLLELGNKLPFFDAAEYLAQNYRPELLPAVKEARSSGTQSPYVILEYKQAELLKMVYEWGKALLYEAQGLEAFNYLTQVRKYDVSNLAKTEWIYWPREKEIREYLRSQLPQERYQEIQDLPLTGNGGDNFRAALPYRDRSGKILTFFKRHTTEKGLEIGEEQKPVRWSSPKGFSKPDLFNLNNCKLSNQHKQSKQLIIAEGLPDAAYLPTQGIENITAVGMGDLSEAYMEGLERCGTKSAIIAFDNDAPDKEGKVGSIEKAKKALDRLEKHKIRAFILPPHLYGFTKIGKRIKDPDEYVREHGGEAFKSLLKQVQTRAAWLPNYIASKHKLDTALGHANALAETAQEYSLLDRIMDRALMKAEAEKVFNLAPSVIEDEFERALKDLKEKEAAELRKKQEEKVQALLQKGDRQGAMNLLKSLEAEEKARTAPEVKFSSDLLAAHDSYLEKYRGKEFVGLPQKKLPTLDKLTLGLRGIGLLAAPPNVGKTALLIQSGVDVLKANPEACVLFLSLEMPVNSIISRIRCHLSGMDWKTLVLGSDRELGRETSFTSEDSEKLKKGNEAFKLYGNRFCVLSGNDFQELTVANLLLTIDSIKAKTNCSRIFVIVDYLQVWPIPHSVAQDIGSNDIELDKWRIGQLKALSEALGDDPVIAISEARKPSERSVWGGDLSDVMGSARGTYTPDMVLMYRSILNDKDLKSILGDIEPEKLEKLMVTCKKDGFDIQKLTLSKGRDGMTKGDVILQFFYRQNRFVELSKEELKELVTGPKAPVKKSPHEVEAIAF